MKCFAALSRVSRHVDRAVEIEPAIHLCFADRLSWLRIDDQLPTVEGNTLPHPSKRGDPRWND